MTPNQQNLANQYNRSKILTASPAELTLMLYEGAIKFCNVAMLGIEQNDIEKAHTNITKAERIISEFLATLDHKYPVAKDFENVYNYIYDKLIEANITKQPEPLEEATARLREMRDTWKEVMRLTKTN